MLRITASAVALALLVFSSALSAQVPNAPLPPKEQLHAELGPHKGQLLEIGKEEYHAEVVIDETKKLMTIYLLDSKAKSAIAIDSPFVAINMKQGGKAVQFKLKATPQDADKAGSASRFQLASQELFGGLHSKGAEAKLAIKIGSKSFAVKIEHNHDHNGHAH